MYFVNNHPFFYLNLEGIILDNTRLLIRNDAFTIKNRYPIGGFIIDSGSNFSYLNKTAFDILVDNLNKRIKYVKRVPEIEKRFGFKLCYDYQWQYLMVTPVLTFHFTGANLYLPSFNTWLKIKGDIHCLAILPTDGRSKLGNFQQQDFNVGYDLENKLFSFDLTYCSDLD
ncbi:hypothetical protein AQUCO_03700152v1 [Aquilegia coerulea]|uniref:Peptidase A1 domain-containing protein n=1 Tax=Aquilegia coerulea TaxID=218851 RepID=A0A2G5CUT5_AQUCA|nr:hypothetical protein AQUCO_03700152v1 [Aquilegia coerulea]